jgi:hypothetical protein
VSLYPQKFPNRLVWDWTWASKPTCSRMTDTVSDTQCLPHTDMLTSKLAVNGKQTSHKISTNGMTSCKVWSNWLSRRRSLPGMQVDPHAQDFIANDKLLLPILKAFVPRLLNIQVPIQCPCLLYSTSSRNVHFGLEHNHKLTKQYNTQFISSQLETPNIFSLRVVE